MTDNINGKDALEWLYAIETVIGRKNAHLGLLATSIKVKSHTYDCLQYQSK